MLRAGDLAPDFELPALIAGVRQRFHLADRLSEHKLLLAFYPSNWEPLSAEQMIAYRVERESLLARQTEVVTINVDSIMNTGVWERQIGPFDFCMCSDFWPHGEVSRQYGVLQESGPHAGMSERAIFVVGRNGRIEFSKLYGFDQLPALHEVVQQLAS
jgi:peroxiredoxin